MTLAERIEQIVQELAIIAGIVAVIAFLTWLARA